MSIDVTAATIATPPGLNPGDKFYVVFVTDGTTTALSSDITSYDSFVATQAASLEYNGQIIEWKALASTASVSAVSRFNPSSGIYRLDGTAVATDGADLWDGFILNPISLTQTGVSVNEQIWTGTDDHGRSYSALGDTSNPFAITGLSSSTGVWHYSSADNFGAYHRLYAFSSALTVVPEPSIAMLFLAGLAATFLRHTRRERVSNMKLP